MMRKHAFKKSINTKTRMSARLGHREHRGSFSDQKKQHLWRDAYKGLWRTDRQEFLKKGKKAQSRRRTARALFKT